MDAARWHQMSLVDQFSNIGSEIDRIISWKAKGNETYSINAFYRAIELLNLSMTDPKNIKSGRLREIGRLREVLSETVLGADIYNTPLEWFSKYFMVFTVLSRKVV